MPDWVDAFVRHLTRRLDRSLHWVSRYHEEGYELRYCRSDLSEADVRRKLDAIFANITGTWSNERELEVLGEATATVQIREKAIIIHIRRGPDRGVVFSVDPYVGRNLQRFVQECDDLIQD